jgi:alkyl hydroperoxide reductase subunit AhpF
MAQINIQVLVANHCLSCPKVIRIINQIKAQIPELLVEIINLDEQPVIPEELNAVIVPATYVNGRLFAYGEFEPRELVAALQRFTKIQPKT